MEITENENPLVNPMLGYTIREDGIITIYARGETGDGLVMEFNDTGLLDSASQGFEDAAFALDMFYDIGPEAAMAYVNEGADEYTVDDAALETFIEGDG